MSEYTLVRDITTYVYPSHIKSPGTFYGNNFFEKWIPLWKKFLGHLPDQPNVKGIEVGVLYGYCAIYCSEKIVNGNGSIHYAIDINDNEYLQNNIKLYKNIQFVKGKSYDILRHNFEPSSIDYIYIDGSHLAIDVLSDAVLSWSLLKDGGILIFDDYGWGVHTKDEKQKPRLAIDAFLSAYVGHYELLYKEWQVFLKKIPYVYSEEELKANYQ
jgi:hypothetical protein